MLYALFLFISFLGVFKRQRKWNVYSSVLDYRQLYFRFLEAILQQCFWMVLADVGGGNENEVCMHKKEIIDVAFACRRVGSKRVKVLSSHYVYN